MSVNVTLFRILSRNSKLPFLNITSEILDTEMPGLHPTIESMTRGGNFFVKFVIHSNSIRNYKLLVKPNTSPIREATLLSAISGIFIIS